MDDTFPVLNKRLPLKASTVLRCPPVRPGQDVLLHEMIHAYLSLEGMTAASPVASLHHPA